MLRYISVDVKRGRNLFYWVVHSEGNVERDPVILWLTGGPGCSSMDALIYEHGPFTFTLTDENDVQLEGNPFSWSKAATMIYVDSPAGAGLSYSETPDDYNTNNERTVEDLSIFLQHLMTIMPELQHQAFYLAGESYGGVYVPLLAHKILDYNKHTSMRNSQDHPIFINLKGYMIGNGVTEDVVDMNAQWEFAYGMGLIDPLTFSKLEAACNGNYWNATKGSSCFNRMKAARDIFYWVNPYDILGTCFRTASGAQKQHDASRLLNAIDQDHHRIWAKISQPGRLQHTVPCGDRRAALQWLASPATRKAIHAASVEQLEWQPCSDILNFAVPFPISLVDLHMNLINEGLKALIYSGDHDFVIPFTGTRKWVYSMNLKVERPFEAWTINRQVAGFVTTFKNLVFATIKGAGHMAPQTHPRESFELISRFLNKEL